MPKVNSLLWSGLFSCISAIKVADFDRLCSYFRKAVLPDPFRRPNVHLGSFSSIVHHQRIRYELVVFVSHHHQISAG